MFVNLKWNDINKETLKNAIINTSKARETLDYIDNASKYIELISDDSRLKSLWNSYQNNYKYAKNISFKYTINSIKKIINILEKLFQYNKKFSKMNFFSCKHL